MRIVLGRVSVRSHVRSSCPSRSPDCMFHLRILLLAQISFTQPFVMVFAAASAEHNDFVACGIYFQCFDGCSPIFSTPPAVEHRGFGHRARSLSTTTFNTFSLVSPSETEFAFRSSFMLSCDCLASLQTPNVDLEASRMISSVVKVMSYPISLMHRHRTAMERKS